LGKFNIPNSFTPNGDGKNDVFRIPPGTAFTLKNLSIFDRWGNKLFSTSDSSQGWDGRYKGQACPAGTYVFMINGSDGTAPLLVKGTVILIR
jgi:gliding motility-associated-like protein